MLPKAPFAGLGNAAVWTGTEMIVWGGTDPAGSCGSDNPIHQCTRDGAAYNPATNSWRKIAAAPLEGRISAAVVWTGREMIVWGGFTSSSGDVASGEAYNPRSNTWRVLPKGPLSARSGAFAVWTGAKMIVFGGTAGQAGGQFTDGAIFDPKTGRWQLLPAAPIKKPATPVQGVGSPRSLATVVWSGSEMILWGGNGPALPGVKTNPGNGADWSAFENGEAYNVETKRWHLVSSAPLKDLANGYGSNYRAVWDGRGMIVIQASTPGKGTTYVSQAASYDPASDSWTPITQTLPPACCALGGSWDERGSPLVFGLVSDRPLLYTP